MGFMYRLKNIAGLGKGKSFRKEESSDRLPKGPQNAEALLKMAQSYEKKGEKEKAISEYLLAANILSEKEFFPQAVAIYEQILKLNPALEEVELKIGEIYERMGSLENAHSQYGRLLKTYNKQGREDKAVEVMYRMAELSMRMIATKEKVPNPTIPEGLRWSEPKEAGAGNILQELPPDGEKKKGAFDLGANLATNPPTEAKGFSKITHEKIYGFEEILKELKKSKISSTTYPDFNFHLGVACQEMGFIDEAIGQFQIALEKGQNPCQAAQFLGRCFRDKGLWKEARDSFERALNMKRISQEKMRKIKDDIDLIAVEKSRKRFAS
jgi:tetratricopeptide (TPR) repeat protein